MARSKKPGVPITSISQLRPGMAIIGRYFGKLYAAAVLGGNRIKVDGLGEFDSIGHAGRAITEGKWTPTLNKGRFWYVTNRNATHDEEDGSVDEQSPSNLKAEDEAADPSEKELQFALEMHLEEFMEANWDRIDFGVPLRLYMGPTGEHGRQFATRIGPVDFLCENVDSGDLVVVELKKGRTSDRVLGQCQRYMGWVRSHVAKPGQAVTGLIIAAEQGAGLKYALLEAPNVEMRCFKVDFQLYDPNTETVA